MAVSPKIECDRWGDHREIRSSLRIPSRPADPNRRGYFFDEPWAIEEPATSNDSPILIRMNSSLSSLTPSRARSLRHSHSCFPKVIPAGKRCFAVEARRIAMTRPGEEYRA